MKLKCRGCKETFETDKPCKESRCPKCKRKLEEKIKEYLEKWRK